MGSSTSKPRKKGSHSHLAKVGTPANEAYEDEVRHGYFGGRWAWVLAIILVLAIFSLIILTAF